MNKLSAFIYASPRPGLHPIPGTTPLTIEAMICPPLIYYLALLLLPPLAPPAKHAFAVTFLRNALALLAAFLFFRLPLAYHVPHSIGLTYQLGLAGLYGGARVVDALFISRYLFGHIPRRMVYKFEPRPGTPMYDEYEKGTAKDALQTAAQSTINQSYFLLHRSLVTGPRQKPVFEHRASEDGWPQTLGDRARWALELLLSMRGVGFTWATADVRHTRRTWLPTVSNRLHSIAVHAMPTLGVSFVVIRWIYLSYALGGDASDNATHNHNPFDGLRDEHGQLPQSFFDTRLPFPIQLILTGFLGAFLMSAFSLAHSAFAIFCSTALVPLGLSPGPLAYFPPLYTMRIWEVTSLRQFWSHGWHRLFARFFLVYGIWPGQWIERMLMGKVSGTVADTGKVLGGFLSSAFCHSFAVRGVLGGSWWLARGEAVFFGMNGVAVVLEEVVKRGVRAHRRRKMMEMQKNVNRNNIGSGSGNEKEEEEQKEEKGLSRWYDAHVGRMWWIGVLLVSGRNFARGWVTAGLVREISGL